MWDSSCCGIPQKTNLRQFTGLHQGTLLEKFKEINLAKVSFLKLLSKGNLACFH